MDNIPKFEYGKEFILSSKDILESKDSKLKIELLNFMIERNDEGAENFATVNLKISYNGSSDKIKLELDNVSSFKKWKIF